MQPVVTDLFAELGQQSQLGRRPAFPVLDRHVAGEARTECPCKQGSQSPLTNRKQLLSNRAVQYRRVWNRLDPARRCDLPAIRLTSKIDAKLHLEVLLLLEVEDLVLRDIFDGKFTDEGQIGNLHRLIGLKGLHETGSKHLNHRGGRNHRGSTNQVFLRGPMLSLTQLALKNDIARGQVSIRLQKAVFRRLGLFFQILHRDVPKQRRLIDVAGLVVPRHPSVAPGPPTHRATQTRMSLPTTKCQSIQHCIGRGIIHLSRIGPQRSLRRKVNEDIKRPIGEEVLQHIGAFQLGHENRLRALVGLLKRGSIIEDSRSVHDAMKRSQRTLTPGDHASHVL